MGRSTTRVEAIGQSEAFLEFQERLSRAATVDRPVLLIGERGTGKELAAVRLHYLSLRWDGPLVTLNCSALSPSLIESELFGYEKGAFTGAGQRRIGRFETANGGTLFLDEIGAIPLEVQEKILRVVEYGTFERVGSSDSIEVDVRIVGATNADLVDLAKQGHFKKDLLDRLSFEVLFLPPLRDRQEDILFLAEHFSQRMAYELGRDKMPEFTTEAIQGMQDYRWEGNVRELKNVVERAVYQSDSHVISHIVFDPFQSPFAPAIHPEAPAVPSVQTVNETLTADITTKPLTEALDHLKIFRLKQALRTAKYNQKKAARLLPGGYRLSTYFHNVTQQIKHAC